MAARSSKFWFKHEKEILKRLGLTPTARSGSGWIEKEDGYTDHVLAQLKSTEASSYRITLDDLRKLEYHAAVENKIPLFIIDFVEPDRQYLVLDVDHIKEVYETMFLGKFPAEVNIMEMGEDENTGPQRRVIKSDPGAREEFKTAKEEYKERQAAKWKQRKKL